MLNSEVFTKNRVNNERNVIHESLNEHFERSMNLNDTDEDIMDDFMMSRVPLVFRDWWDDFSDDFSPRTSRLLDQHFGTGLRRDDLFSSLSATPRRSPLSRSGYYYRPWSRTTTDLSKADSGSTVKDEPEKYEVILDVAQFTPEEITVKTTDRYICVEGKHDEKKDEHGFVSRQFTRRYLLPEGHDPNDVISSLSSDGVLTVTAPKKSLPPPGTERTVPITPTGPKKDSKDKENESQPKVETIN